MEIVEGEITKIKVAVGGIAAFLECEEKPSLIAFYENAGYSYFGERVSIKGDQSIIYKRYIKTI